jgi:hypothetical protein
VVLGAAAHVGPRHRHARARQFQRRPHGMPDSPISPCFSYSVLYSLHI